MWLLIDRNYRVSGHSLSSQRIEENRCILILPDILPHRWRTMLGWGSTFNLTSRKPVNNFTLFLSKWSCKSWSQPHGLTIFLFQFSVPELRGIVLGILIKTQHLRTAFRTKCQPLRKEMDKTVRRVSDPAKEKRSFPLQHMWTAMLPLIFYLARQLPHWSIPKHKITTLYTQFLLLCGLWQGFFFFLNPG